MQKFYAILIILQILVQTTYALDPLYEYRYTLGPEILVPDALHVGAGFYTHYNQDGKAILNFQIGLTDEFEAGLKWLAGTNDSWIIAKDKPDQKYRKHSGHIIDVGAKVALKPHLTLQADVPIALNEDWDWGGVLSLTQWTGYAKNLSFLYEFRLGFGGAAGEESYVKPAVSFFPNFQIGQSFRVSVGTITSFSFENIQNDFMLDILPKVEAGLKWFRLTGEVSIGILSWEAKRYNRYAVFIVSDV
ncbi:MAG: hypothetical protein FWC15_02940 [Fibromonadales bacterium]|nr:hypothetical protein [Fibromonadales bacterium]